MTFREDHGPAAVQAAIANEAGLDLTLDGIGLIPTTFVSSKQLADRDHQRRLS